MPAPAVIPAPIAYANIVAVKKLVVGSRVRGCKVAQLGRPVRRFGVRAWLCQVVDSTLCVRPLLFIHGISSPAEASLIGGGSDFAFNTRIRSVRGCYCEQNSVSKATFCTAE